MVSSNVIDPIEAVIRLRESQHANRNRQRGTQRYQFRNGDIATVTEDERRIWQAFERGLTGGQVRPAAALNQALFRECLHSNDGYSLGDEALRCWREGRDPERRVREAIDTSAFAKITNQLLFAEVKTAFEKPVYVGGGLIRTVPTKRIHGEIIAGLTLPGDDATRVGEGKPYPRASVSDELLETPATTKQGLIVDVTKEAVIEDTLGQVVEYAAKVGDSLAYNKEMRIISEVVGTTNSYRRNGTSYDTYQTTTPWDNISASTPFLDHYSIDTVMQVFAGMKDLNTGLPVSIVPNTIVCGLALRARIMQALGQTQVSMITVDAGGSSNNLETFSPGQMGSMPTLSVVSSIYLSASLTTTWIVCDPMSAFSYREVWPITVTQIGAGSTQDHERDVVLSFKASERGVCATVNPQATVKATAGA